MLIKFTRKETFTHIIIWSLLIAYLFSFYSIDATLIKKIYFSLIFYIDFIFLFYSLCLYVLPKYWDLNKKLFFISLLILLLIYYLIAYFNWNYVYPKLVREEEHRLLKPEFYFFKNFFVFYAIVCTVAISYYIRKLRINKIKIQNEKETILLKKELNFFKNQFNPHITFNFLNHIYSIANKHSKETAKAIELYSDLLRHYNRDTNDKVSLQNEVEYLNNYIKLKKILTKDVFVNLSTKSKLGNIFIYQRILITFVENAFKHGIYNKPDDPIIINLEANETEMHFFVENGINTNRKVVSSGIGLENARQILDLRYPDKYSLISEKKNDRFYCKLKLNLC